MNNYSTSSGLKTADAQISTLSGSLRGIDVKAADSGSNVLTIYDSYNSSTSGKLILAIVEADAGLVSVNHEFMSPIVVNNGIYVTVTGDGTSFAYIIRYTV